MDLLDSLPEKIKDMFVIPGSPTGYLLSGSFLFDIILSGGKGYPLGGIIELAGEPDSGKTSLGLIAISEAKRKKGYGLIINTERNLEAPYLKLMGAEDTPLIQSPQLTLEQVFQVIETFVDNYIKQEVKQPAVILWDSGANTYSKEEVKWSKPSKKESKPAVRASHLSEWLRQGIVSKLNKTKILLLITNHLKETFIPKWLGQSLESPLGRSLKYLCLSRNLLEQKGRIGDPPDGIIIQAKNVSGKHKKAYRIVRFIFYPDERRIDNYESLVDYVRTHELLDFDMKGRTDWDGQKLFASQLLERIKSDIPSFEKLKKIILDEGVKGAKRNANQVMEPDLQS